MKTRNLLLAGLVAVAMSACSNSEDVVDNSQPKGEKATMQLQLNFAGAAGRAATVGAPSKGEEFEYKAASITALLVYGESNERIVVPGIKVQELYGETNVVTTTEFEVAAGNNVKIYAFVNPTVNSLENLSSANLATMTIGQQASPAIGIDYLNETVAKSGNFMMCTKGNPTPITINAGTVNTAKFSVERIAAKLEEKSGVDKYTIEAPTAMNAENMSIKMIRHTYSNLSDNSTLLGNDNNYTGSFFQPYTTPATVETYQWKECNIISSGNDNISSAITYSLENINKLGYDIAKNTSVIYEGQVSFDSTVAGTFYTAKKVDADKKVKTFLYKSWEALGKDFDLTGYQSTDRTKLEKIGIKTYVDGKCYYIAPIEESTRTSITRNSWYKLHVSKIKDLGFDYPVKPTPETETMLSLEVSIEPWTVYINEIEL